jgi:hypothetical protein
MPRSTNTRIPEYTTAHLPGDLPSPCNATRSLYEYMPASADVPAALGRRLLHREDGY